MAAERAGGGPCPACPTARGPEPLESHRDPIGGKTYRVLRCPECGTVFSEPREAVGPEWYEKAAPIRHLENRGRGGADWRYQTFFAEGLPPGKLLDVGCGGGEFVAQAKQRGFLPTGFDYERRMVALAREKGIADVEAGEFSEFCARRREGEFEVITLFDVLEHTPEPARLVARLKPLLKPGGHVVITLPNADRPLPWGREEHDYPPHHFTRWTPRAMRGFLERQGFAVVHQEAGELKVSYLADHFFFYVLMPGLLGLAKRLLFGRGAPEGSISEIYSSPAVVNEAAGQAPRGGAWRRRLRAALAEKRTRQGLVNACKFLCAPLVYAVSVPLTAYYLAARGGCGDCLYTLARRDI